MNLNKFYHHHTLADRDGDEALDWEEYSSIPSDSLLVRYSGIRKKDEFLKFIDINKDGKLDKREILVTIILIKTCKCKY